MVRVAVPEGRKLDVMLRDGVGGALLSEASVRLARGGLSLTDDGKGHYTLRLYSYDAAEDLLNVLDVAIQDYLRSREVRGARS